MHTFNKGGTDITVVMDVRQGIIQPIVAPGWLDLRVGFFMSITLAGSDDTITGGLPETITSVADPSIDYFIGVKTSDSNMPTTPGTTFIGYHCHPAPGLGDTKLVSSDLAKGTTNSDYWRPYRQIGTVDFGSFFSMLDSSVPRSFIGNSYIHFVQNYAGGHAAGYADLLMFRLTRPDATTHANLITAQSHLSSFSFDTLYSSTPTEAVLQTNLGAFPTSNIQTIGPTQLNNVPNALYWYWPFLNSQLRIHSSGFFQAL